MRTVRTTVDSKEVIAALIGCTYVSEHERMCTLKRTAIILAKRKLNISEGFMDYDVQFDPDRNWFDVKFDLYGDENNENV